MRRSRRRQQHGVIFLALILVLVVGGSAFTLSALNNRQSAKLSLERDVYEEMELVRQALISYARYTSSLYPDAPGVSPGLLPCPDLDNDGISDTDCDPTTEYSGRLPQYVQLPYNDANGNPARFYLSSTYAGTDRQFWYAVSPNFLHTSTGTLSANSAQAATLTVDTDSDIIAVILAPGEALEGQDRGSSPNDYAQYLEGGNGLSQTFITKYDANPTAFNDTVLAIRRSEVRDENVYRAAAASIQTRLEAYYSLCGYYPRPYRKTDCSSSSFFDTAYNTDPKAFLKWIHASNTVLWMQETAYGGDNWVDTNAMKYDYASGTVTLDFK